MGGWLQFGRGEVGWERRRGKRRINRGRECRQSGYIMAFTDGITDEQVSLVKSSEINPRHHTVATFQKNCIGHRRYGRYILIDLEKK